MKKKSGNQAPEEIEENDIEVCLGSSVLPVESGEEKGEGEEKREKREKLCAEQNSATVNPEEECEFLIEKPFDLSSVSGVSIFRNKQQPQKKRTSALFEENREAQQHKKRKNKRELEKTVMPIPVHELSTILYDVGETSLGGFQNASRINQVMAVENDKSQNQAKDHIPLLEAEQKLSVQIQPVKKAKQSSSQNKLTTQTKVKDEKQESNVLALPSKDCTQSKNTVIYSDNSVSMPCFVPVAHNTLDKKLQLPFKKQSGTQKKKSTVGHMRNKKEQFVSKESLEDGHGEEQLDKKKILHPVKLRAKLKREKPQKVKETSLPKSQNNVLYQEDSCEQHVTKKHVTKKHLNVSVTPQNNEEPLSHHQLLPPLYNNEMFRRKLHPYNANDSDSGNTYNVRRSKRIRIKPLEYWRGERVYYKIDTSGDFVNGGIIVPEEREPRKRKAKVVTKSVPEIENLHVNSTFKPILLFDKASNQQILQECMHNGRSPVFYMSNEILSIYKYLNTPSFAAGKIILNPLKEKGYQYSLTDTLIFHVKNGKLLLMLSEQSYYLTDGNYFFIPPGNAYNIRNLLNKECVLLFTQLKEKEHFA